MSLYMETTKKEARTTVAEIQSLLGGSRAVRACHTEFDEEGEVASLGFVINVRGNDVPFRLPARFEPVFEHLQLKRSPQNRAKPESIERDRDQAVRVAWRQILRWVQAQLALVECGMVDMAEVFLPYALVQDNETTLYDRFIEGSQRMLEAPK